MNSENNENYYVINKLKIMKKFSKMEKHVITVLLHNFKEKKVNQLIKKVHEEFEKLLPQLPYIGGKKNGLTFNLVGSAYTLVYIRILEKEGLSHRSIGKILYDTNECYYKSQSRFLKWLLRKFINSKLAIRKAKKSVKKSQLRKYPGDWVLEIIESEGESFDLGINYTECGIYKLYKEMGAENYVPYLCLTDYAMAREFGYGLIRTQTIGNGAPICDFRFKKKYQTPPGWPPENLEEFNEKITSS